MLRPSLVACSECACHVRANEEVCPHCGAQVAGAVTSVGDARRVKRAAVAVSLGLAVSVANLSAGCDDTSNTGGAGGATVSSGSTSIAAYGVAATNSTASGSTTGSDSSSIAAYGVAATSTGVGGASSSSGN